MSEEKIKLRYTIEIEGRCERDLTLEFLSDNLGDTVQSIKEFLYAIGYHPNSVNKYFADSE